MFLLICMLLLACLIQTFSSPAITYEQYCLQDFNDCDGFSLLQKHASLLSGSKHVGLSSLRKSFGNIEQSFREQRQLIYETAKGYHEDILGRGLMDIGRPSTSLLSTNMIIFFAVSFLVIAFCFSTTGNILPTDGGDRAQTMRTSLFMCYFVAYLAYSSSILTSYNLSQALGKDAAWSGFVIGMFSPGQLLGSLIIWMMTMRCDDFWRQSSLTGLLFGISCLIIGLCLYMFVAIMVQTGHILADLPSLLVGSHVVSGIGQGVIMQLVLTIIPKITDACDQPRQMVTFQLVGLSGFGAGMLLSVVGVAVTRQNPWTPTAWLNISLAVSLFGWLTSRWPASFDEAHGEMNPKLESKQKTVPDYCRQSVVVTGCLLMSFLRGSYVTAVEVASTLLLQVDFHWNLIVIGLSVGVVLLIATPVYFLLKMHTGQRNVSTMIRAMYASCLIGCILLLTTGYFGAWIILVSDAIVFPTIAYAGGLSLGIMMQHVLPEGYFLDLNTTILLSSVLNAGIGRPIAAYLARWLIQQHGILGYAIGVFVVLASVELLFEAVVNPIRRDYEVLEAPALKT